MQGYKQTYRDVQIHQLNLQGMYNLNQRGLIVLRYSSQVKFA